MRIKKIKKVIKLVVIACMVVPACLLLVIGPSPDGNLPKDRVIVDYWEKWTGDEESQMRQIVDQFNDTVGKEKGIYVRYISTSGIDRKTLLATAGGVPPDIAGMWDANVVQYAALDALMPLDELAKEHGITSDIYKKVYWDGCNYNGKLCALVSTPAAIALHYNKRIFQEKAAELRKAGLDPDRAPRTLAELDEYAKVLDEIGPGGRIIQAGYLPSVPGWYLNYTPYWFGASYWDAKTHKFTLTDPGVVAAYDWIASYSRKLGKDASSEFNAGLGSAGSPQNPFLTGAVVMEQQGPWMANYIENLKPSMSHVLWTRQEELKQSPSDRLKNYEWGVAPFPSAMPGLKDVTYCTFDSFVIPRGAKHPREAFEFMAYVNRQDVMEQLCSLHCKNSPLKKVSESFINNHPNPYIREFERLASSENAHGVPQVPISMEVGNELSVMTQSIILLNAKPADILAKLQVQLQARYDRFEEIQKQRHALEQ